MTRHRLPSRNLMTALLVLVLLLLGSAVRDPSPTVRRVAFAIVLFTAVLLLVLVLAKLDQHRVEVKALRATVTRHVALCEARTVDAKVDSAFALLGEQRSA